MSDDEDGFYMAGEPIIGFKVGSGQLEGINEEGVITAPVVGLVLVNPAQEEHCYTLPAPIVDHLCDALTKCQEVSMAQYFKREYEQIEKSVRTEKRTKRILLLVGLIVVATFGALQGQVESTRYVHAGGIAEGVSGGIDEAFRFVGMITAYVFAAIYGKRVIDRFKRRRAQRRTKLSPDAPPAEQIP